MSAKSAECECGNAKSPKKEACERCLFLDGSSKDPRAIGPYLIAALRALGSLSPAELAELTGAKLNTVEQAAGRLVKAGRFGRFYREIDAGESEETQAHGGRLFRGAQMRVLYYLKSSG